MFGKKGSSPTKGTARSPSVRVQNRVLTRADVTTGPALAKWREIYSPLLPEIQARLPEEQDPDELIRFLCDWGGNVDTCVEKYHARIKYRREQLPVVVDDGVKASIATGKFAFELGYDRVGRPVVYYRVRYHDPRKFPPAVSVRHLIYEYERMRERIEARSDYVAGSGMDEVTVVIDRTGSGLRNTDIEFLKAFYAIFKDYYPGRAEVFIVYGVNVVFKGIWAAVKPFLDYKSQGITHLINSKRELLEFIAEEQLPVFLGGSLSAPSPAPLSPAASEEPDAFVGGAAAEESKQGEGPDSPTSS